MHHPGASRLVHFILLLIMGLSLLPMVHRRPLLAQDVPMATPDAEGIIYALVEPNDSLWAIANRAGISLQQLLELNGMTEVDIIHPGQLLIVGRGTPPPTATTEVPTPTVTPTRPPPTPTSTMIPPPRTAICLEAFDDLDRDGIHETGEPMKAAVAFTVFNEETVVGNYITDGISEPYCLEGLTPGDYKVTRSVRRDETLTTSGDWVLTLTAGSVLNLEFGSHAGVAATPTAPLRDQQVAVEPAVTAITPSLTVSSPAEGGELSTLVAIGFIAVLLLVVGGGLVVAGRARGKNSNK